MTSRIAQLRSAVFLGLLAVLALPQVAPAHGPDCEAQATRAARGCIHGPDPAPPGRDVKRRRTVAELQGESGTATTDRTAGVACIGDGTSGDRVQAVYAVAADRADRYSSVAPLIRDWAEGVEQIVAQSAAQRGATRHVRFVTQSCQVSVLRAVIPSTGDDDIYATADALAALGLDRRDRKYLIWMDANVYCGIAYMPGIYARVDNGCWGYAETHELFHNFGAVSDDAPNSSLGGHCTDEHDVMCYSDAPHYPAMRIVCGTEHETRLDCNGDDYFHPSPWSGTFLSREPEANTADSTFLVDADGQVPVYLPDVPSGYAGDRWKVRAYNADDDLCVYGRRLPDGPRTRLFCVGYHGEREADVTGALVELAAPGRRVQLELAATDRGGARTFGFQVRRGSELLVDDRDGEVGVWSSSRPLGPNDPTSGWPTSFGRTIDIDLNVAPVAGFTISPTSPVAGVTATLTSTSTDADGTVAAVAWDLDGDGSYDDGAGAEVSHDFPSAGALEVGVSVTDDAGATGVHRQAITVTAAPPPPSGGTGNTGTSTGSGSSGWSTTTTSSWSWISPGTGMVITTTQTWCEDERLVELEAAIDRAYRRNQRTYRSLMRRYRQLRRAGWPPRRSRAYRRDLRRYERARRRLIATERERDRLSAEIDDCRRQEP